MEIQLDPHKVDIGGITLATILQHYNAISILIDRIKDDEFPPRTLHKWDVARSIPVSNKITLKVILNDSCHP